MSEDGNSSESAEPAGHEKVIQALRDGETYESAANAGGISVRTLWDRRQRDPQLAAACDAARKSGEKLIEERIVKALYAGASKVADDPRYTGAACFALTNLNSAKFRNTHDVRHTGSLAVRIADLTAEEAEALAHATDDDTGNTDEAAAGPVAAGG